MLYWVYSSVISSKAKEFIKLSISEFIRSNGIDTESELLKQFFAAVSASIDVLADINHSIDNAMNYVGETVVDFGNAIDEKLSFVLSNNVKKAAERISSHLQKIDNFCQASIGSYRYYTELKGAAGQSRSLFHDDISRHRILRVYQQSAQEATKKAKVLSRQEEKVVQEMQDMSRLLEEELEASIRVTKEYYENKGTLITQSKDDIIDSLRVKNWFQNEVDHIIEFKLLIARQGLSKTARNSQNKKPSKPKSPLFDALRYACEAMGSELKDVLNDEYERFKTQRRDRKGRRSFWEEEEDEEEEEMDEIGGEEFRTDDYHVLIQETIKRQVMARFTTPLSLLIPHLDFGEVQSSTIEEVPHQSSGEDPIRARSSRSEVHSTINITALEVERRDWLLNEFHRITNTVSMRN